MCITSEQLTDKWKKGELLDGWYYTEIDLYENGDFIEIIPNVYNDCFEYGIIKQVLAPVPSYEEYRELLSDQLAKNEGVEINAELEERLKKTQKLELDLRKENTKLKTENKWYSEQLHAWVDRAGDLKELLKECRDEIEYLRKHYKGSIDHLKNNTRLDKEINQVLGEE